MMGRIRKRKTAAVLLFLILVVIAISVAFFTLPNAHVIAVKFGITYTSEKIEFAFTEMPFPEMRFMYGSLSFQNIQQRTFNMNMSFLEGDTFTIWLNSGTVEADFKLIPTAYSESDSSCSFTMDYHNWNYTTTFPIENNSVVTIYSWWVTH